MTFSDEDQRRIEAMVETMTAIARGSRHAPAEVLQLGRAHRVGSSRAGSVGVAIALAGSVAGGAVFAIRAGVMARPREAIESAVSIQRLPDVVGSSPKVETAMPAPVMAAVRRLPRRRSVAAFVRHPDRAGPAPASLPSAPAERPFDAAMRRALAEDSRLTRELNEEQLDDLPRP